MQITPTNNNYKPNFQAIMVPTKFNDHSSKAASLANGICEAQGVKVKEGYSEALKKFCLIINVEKGSSQEADIFSKIQPLDRTIETIEDVRATKYSLNFINYMNKLKNAQKLERNAVIV